jgi:hypothetical protein
LRVLLPSGRWSAASGVRKLVMDGKQPARVPDAVIAEIPSRENRAGFVELQPRPNRFRAGDRVLVVKPRANFRRRVAACLYRIRGLLSKQDCGP